MLLLRIKVCVIFLHFLSVSKAEGKTVFNFLANRLAVDDKFGTERKQSNKHVAMIKIRLLSDGTTAFATSSIYSLSQVLTIRLAVFPMPFLNDII